MLEMASLEFIRTRPEELGGEGRGEGWKRFRGTLSGNRSAELSEIDGNPLFAGCVSSWLRSIESPLSLSLRIFFLVPCFPSFFTSRSIPAIVCLRTCAHTVRRESMILTRRKEKERREKKTSWTHDDGCSVCFNPWKSMFSEYLE